MGMNANSYNRSNGIYMLDILWNECLISMDDFVVMHSLLSELHYEEMRKAKYDSMDDVARTYFDDMDMSF